MEHFDTIVIGAGSAGCVIGHHLKAQGKSVVILDKSRGSGGRCARRSIEGSNSIDLGCISLTQQQIDLGLSDPIIANILAFWREQKLLLPWQVNYGSTFDSHWVGVPNMNSLHKSLLTNVDLRTAHKVIDFERGEHGNWIVNCEDDLTFTANQLIVTSPPLQSEKLSDDWPQAWQTIFETADTSILPQWCCVLELPTSFTPTQNGWRQHSVIDHAVLDSSKPQRQHDKQLWVVQATPEWTQKHLNLDAAHAGDLLCDAFCAILDIDSDKAIRHSSHRWLFGRTSGFKVDPGCLWDDQLQLGVCADWLNGGGMMAAMLSAATLLKYMDN